MRGPKILIVEDEQIVALDLKERIQAMGYGVAAVAGTGDAAIAQSRAVRPDLVLMDIKLQDHIDGIEASDRIRRELDVPIVFVTAYADAKTLERAKAALPLGYVLKPFEDRELQVVIELALYRHDTERRLRESEAWLHATLRSEADAVIATNADGTVRFMNPLAEFLTGWKRDDARGLRLDRIFQVHRAPSPPEDPIAHDVLLAKDGSERPVECQATPIRDEAEHSYGVVWVFRDITERKRVEDGQRLMARTSALLTSSLDFASTIAKATGPVVPLLGDWCLVDLLEEDDHVRPVATAHANGQKAKALRTLTRRKLLGLDVEGVSRVIHSGKSELHNDIAGQERLRRALAIERRDPVWALEARSLICVPLSVRREGRVLGALTLGSERPARRYGPFDLLLAEDLARRIAVAIDNARLYRDTQRAVGQREEVLAIVSHDLKNPLATILANAQMIARAIGDSDDRIRKRAIGVVHSAERMYRLISDLLDVGKIDAGQLAIRATSWSAARLIREAVEMFETDASDRSIDLQAPAVSDDLAVHCDRDRVLQVFANLIGNALKFAPEGGHVRVEARRADSDIRFSVEDDGPGVPPEQRSHLFERYWQPQHAVHKGTGLGLYIAKGIVDAHGGHIGFEPAAPRGCRFWFTLPAAMAAPLG